ncbi:MAG TPA: tRNA (adenosine(37)-N6)-threonylcarbamoyltransferase complex dimerization subunit type 1 TsaB [Chthoniobacterales bacterium]|nr:tRNA (adenosine(37)-N6)-threonylcarbamoyltransferase complex dimerization subunit type 1 TsaB [Chthoniobacterales bacterium]
MKILALELSTARGSLAYLSDAAEFARDWPHERKNSAAFFANLADVQKQFGLPERMIVGLGPGSYAGTRIAISAAVGLQFASGAELVGLPSICAVECDAVEYCVIGDARRQSFFFARICANELVEGPELLGEIELRAKMETLDVKMSIFASEELPQFPRVQVRYPSARVLARLARDANRGFVLPPLEPMYLREPHITVPKST